MIFNYSTASLKDVDDGQADKPANYLDLICHYGPLDCTTILERV